MRLLTTRTVESQFPPWYLPMYAVNSNSRFFSAEAEGPPLFHPEVNALISAAMALVIGPEVAPGLNGARGREEFGEIAAGAAGLTLKLSGLGMVVVIAAAELSAAGGAVTLKDVLCSA